MPTPKSDRPGSPVAGTLGRRPDPSPGPARPSIRPPRLFPPCRHIASGCARRSGRAPPAHRHCLDRDGCSLRAMAGRRLKLGQNCLEVDDQPIEGVLRGDKPARFRTDAASVCRARTVLDTLMAALPLPDVPPAVWRAVARFRGLCAGDAGDGLVMAAGGLIGLGPGSTPAGDDVLAATTCNAHSPSHRRGKRSRSRSNWSVASLRAAIVDRTQPHHAAVCGPARGRG